MPKPLVRIVAAIPEEVRHLCRCHGLTRLRGKSEAPDRWRGEVRGQAVRVAVTGIGAERARRGVEGLLACDPSRAFVFIGTAGALSRQLRVGDLLVAERILASEDLTSVVPVPASTWSARAAALTRAQPATLLSTPRIVATATEKSEMARLVNLEPDLLGVDMESYAWASAMRESGVPFVVLRAVSDTAQEDLPVDLGRALRPDGSLSRARVLAGASRRPASVQGLFELRDRVKLCSRILEQAVVSIFG